MIRSFSTGSPGDGVRTIARRCDADASVRIDAPGGADRSGPARWGVGRGGHGYSPNTMSATAEHLNDPELLRTEWDLGPLVDRDGEAGVERLLEEASRSGGGFAEQHAGKVRELDSAGLLGAMHG